MSKPSAPPAPDYAGSARAQGTANRETARTESLLNNPNVNNVYGSRNVTYSTVQTPWGDEIQPTINESLSPDQQQLYDRDQSIMRSLGTLAEGQLGRVSGAMGTPFDARGIPTQVSSLGEQDWRTGYDSGGNIQRGVDTSPLSRMTTGVEAGPLRNSSGYSQPLQYDIGDAGQIQRSIENVGPMQRGLNYGGAPNLPGSGDFSRDRDLATQSIVARNQPFADSRRTQLETQLTNQGLRPGTEAWDNAMRQFDNSQNDFMLGAIGAGGAEQSRQFGLGMQARQQGVSEANTQGQFANQAQQQAFNQALQSGQFGNEAQQMAFGQNLARGNFYNQAQGQGYNQAMGEANLFNSTQAQQFDQGQANAALNNAVMQAQTQGNIDAGQFTNQAQAQANQQNANAAGFTNNALQQNMAEAQANANMQNQARQQWIQEQMQLRNMPLNELNALRSGVQVQTPQFQNYQASQIAPPPIFGATQAQGQWDQNMYNQQVGSANNFMSGLMGIGGSYAYGVGRRGQ